MDSGCSAACGYVGGCQNSGPFLGPYYNTAPNNSGDPKRDHNLTITHMWPTVTIEECSFGSESSKDLNTEVSGLGFRV